MTVLLLGKAEATPFGNTASAMRLDVTTLEHTRHIWRAIGCLGIAVEVCH